MVGGGFFSGWARTVAHGVFAGSVLAAAGLPIGAVAHAPAAQAAAVRAADGDGRAVADRAAVEPRAFPTPAPSPNPDLPEQCGLNIAIVLDLSNSLTDGDVAASKEAATEFVDALEGTPSSIGVYTFATFSPATGNANLGATSVATGSGADTVRDHIDDLDRPPSGEGGTNWDTGISQVPTGVYDAIVFVTDGNPTAQGTPGTPGNGDFGSVVDQIDIDRGTASANAHKDAGTTVISLGVGGAVNVENITYVSGTAENDDYYLVGNYDELADTLREIALSNCTGTLTVVKQVRGLDGQLSPGAGWTFTTTTPDVTPGAGVTGVNGAVNFVVDGYDEEIASRPVTVTETLQEYYELEQQNGVNAVCTDRATGQSVPAANAGELGFTVDVPRDGVISCTVVNEELETFDDLTVTKTATPSFDRTYEWSIEKLADEDAVTVPGGATATVGYSVLVTPSAPIDSGFAVSGQITVTNPNDVPFDGVTLTDTLDGASCTIDGVAGPVTVQPGETAFDYTCQLPDGTTAETSGTNSVEVTWAADDPLGTTGQASASAAFDFAAVEPDTTNDVVTVTDSEIDLGQQPGGNVVDAADGPRTFTYPIGWPGVDGTCTDYQNVATLTQEVGEPLQDDATVEVCAGADLSMTKNVILGFDRTYAWSIEKSADPTEVTIGPETGPYVIGYTVTVTAGEATDSNWSMTGEITVENPNDWQDVALTDVTDAVDVGGGATCTVDDAELTVPAGGTLTLPYTCTFTSQPAYDGTNTATVTWDAAAAATPNGAASGTAQFAAADWAQTPIDQTITIVDDYAVPGEAVEIGEVTWTEAGEVMEFGYFLDFAGGAPGECVTYTNTATIVETAQSSSADVEVCVEEEPSPTPTPTPTPEPTPTPSPTPSPTPTDDGTPTPGPSPDGDDNGSDDGDDSGADDGAEDGDDDGSSLPDTGSGSSAMMLGGAVLLMLAGAFALRWRARRE